ncbi:uncharacterized protein [Palaemon carinicauda]|uniref:uncharacterized protein n=1 Tax=Palaemon carinicauda TaxID=392227 RepID=UPI0035B649A8
MHKHYIHLQHLCFVRMTVGDTHYETADTSDGLQTLLVTFLLTFFSCHNSSNSYVRANSGQGTYTFIIPMMGCGTRTFDNDDGSTGFENMIMIQHEEIVQEIWDTARKITCNWSSRMEKLITFRPFAVDMLPAKNVQYSGDDVMCWMDIKLGKGPFSNTVDGIVKIGDELTIVIYSKDGSSEFDMLVKNCMAYDSEDLEDERTTRIQLSDDRGCLLKPKLMSYFFRTKDTGTTGADIIAYASLFAFKFPDKMDVYLSCEVELCKGGCSDVCDNPEFPTNQISRFISSSTSTTTTRPPPIINPCVTQPGLPQCCRRNPTHPSCTDPCIKNPGLPECCAKNPNTPQCTKETSTILPKLNPCLLDPTSRECCIKNPNSLLCRTTVIPTTTTRPTTTTKPNPCFFNPASRECCAINPNSISCRTTQITTTTTAFTTQPSLCTVNPNSPMCKQTSTTTFDPCLQDPTSRDCCSVNPSAPQCIRTIKPATTTTLTTTSSRIDPCILNPRSPQCCIRNPSSIFCTTTTTARPEPCDINPFLLKCCTRNPNLPHCANERKTTIRTSTTTRTTTRPTTTSTTTRPTTTRTTTRPTTTRTTSRPTTTTRSPDPCDLSPSSVICCARKPFSPECIIKTTTPQSNPCDLNPRSPQCCSINPRSPLCIKTTPSTPRPSPCDLNPRSPQCCTINPWSPMCTTVTSTTSTTTRSVTTTRRPSTRITSTERPTTRISSTERPTTKRIITTRRPTTTFTSTSQPSTTQFTTRKTTTGRPTTKISTTTQRIDPCDLNPGSNQCCIKNPTHPECVQSTSQRITATTKRPDPCTDSPGSPACCALNPSNPRCLKETPCTGPNDTRPKCIATTATTQRTTPNLEFHAFHRWHSGPTTSQRRRRPPYGTRLSSDVLAELSNIPRRRRDIALPPPPPPPPRNVVSMVKGFRVVGANDLTFQAVSLVPHAAVAVDSVCVPTATFAVSLLMLSILLITAVLTATFSCLRLRSLSPSKAVEAKNPYYKQ